MRKLFALLPVVMLVVVACGSVSSPTSSATKTTTTSCLTVTSGTIKQTSADGLLLTTLQGKSVLVTLTGATTYIRQSTITPSGIKVGAAVSVVIALNADNTYSALTVSMRSALSRQSGFTSGAKLCSGSGQFPRRFGTPGAFGGRGSGGGTPSTSGSGQALQTISGTVSQIDGNALTVTDTSGNDLTVTLTATTRITAQETVSVSDFHSGVVVTVTGTANSQGVISANSVAILQSLPTRRPTATPTTTAQ